MHGVVEFCSRAAVGRNQGIVPMKVYGRLMVFSLVACIAYTLAYYFDWPLFQYYLEENRFHFTVQPPSSGPPILWYGWLATAVLAGAAFALVVPRRLLT